MISDAFLVEFVRQENVRLLLVRLAAATDPAARAMLTLLLAEHSISAPPPKIR